LNTLLRRASNNGRYATFNTQTIQQSDVSLTVDLLPADRAASYELLLSCRWQDAANYTALLIRVTPEATQAFIIKLVAGDSNIFATADLTAEQWQATTQLNGRCQGPDLSLSLNGTTIIQGTDPNPTSGDIALMTRPIQANTPHQLIFDNLIVTTAVAD